MFTGMSAKVSASIVGAFLTGFTALYTADPLSTWLSLVMAGLAPVAAYIVGLSQTAPAMIEPVPVVTPKKARSK